MKRWKGRRSKTSIKFDHLGSVGIHSIGVMKTAPGSLSDVLTTQASGMRKVMPRATITMCRRR